MKALVLLSGGVESTTCLAIAVEKYGSNNVFGLTFSYGQKHNKEIESARILSKHYKTELIELDLSTMFQFSDCSLLSHSEKDIPKDSYLEQQKLNEGKPVSTYVPFRNGLFLSAAASIALSKNCQIIYYGAQSDDSAGNAYPDCSKEFNEAMNKAIYEGSGKQVSIEAPFVGLNKADVVKKGLELGVPYEYTWSCYEGGDKPCEVCATCIDRIKAFEKNGITDPLLKKKD